MSGSADRGHPLEAFRVDLDLPTVELDVMIRTQGQAVPPLVAPYTPDARRWITLRWTDLDAPDRDIKFSPDPAHPGRAVVDTYATILTTYLTHPEAKSLDADGNPCDRATSGVLRRRHVELHTLIAIGKEANELGERSTGMASELNGGVRPIAYGTTTPI